MAVEVLEARAMARKARVSLKDEANAKVMCKAKVEDAKALARRTRTRIRTRTRTGPGETATLRQEGPILSPLVGSKTRRLRPVPRGNLNKNKKLSVPTKMGTSLTPANVPASYGWRKNRARSGLTLPVPPSSKRDALGDLQIWCSGYVSVLGNENTWGYWILGLLCQLWPRKLGNIIPTAAIHIGDGHVVQSCRDCEVDVPMGSRNIPHQFYVMDTEAFDFVLWTDFFAENSQILSLTLQAPYVLHVDHGDGRESVPLEHSEHVRSYLRQCRKEPSAMMVASETEDYQLLEGVRD